MLNSWFASKDHDKATCDTPSFDPRNTNTVDGPDENLRISHVIPVGFTSPHDAILAQIRGQSHVQPTDDALLRGKVPGSKKEEQNNVPETTVSMLQDCTTEKDRVVYDPFGGTPIGSLMTPLFDSKLQAETTSTASLPSSRTGDGEKKLEQWEHLSQVLDLQNELARMHLEMEGVGIGDGKGKTAGKGKGRGKGKGDAIWERSRGDLAKEWKPQRQTTTDTIGADVHEGDEEGVDAAGNEENVMKKDREERFSTMADQFEGRKEAVQAIMNKLDHLSKALTQFHTLQAPDFEFSKTDSGQNSTSISDVTPLTNSRLSNTPDGHPLRPILSYIPSLHGSLSSPPQATLEPEVGSLLPASLSRPQAKGTTFDESVYVNEMEPERQMHIIDSPESMKGSVVLPP
ncbi:hypothetical protein H2248_001154 [Termitomyces sp. 'cryptogamus']|nr:hypothetical protein H2248_001154 [Termitomyces sp. 'cryptogamus']